MPAEIFSDRYGYHADNVDVEITVREDAPNELRCAIPQIARQLEMSFTSLREVICRTLLVQPDPYNWTEIPNVRDEVNNLIGACPWFKVYDIAEALHDEIWPDRKQKFSDRLNQFFHANGIGWEMLEGQIMYRGSDVFTESTQRAVAELRQSNRPRAASEIQEALRDISRRPTADVTGSIQHAMAAIESTAQGRNRSTQLQHWVRLVPKLDLPAPLDTAVDKTMGLCIGSRPACPRR